MGLIEECAEELERLYAASRVYQVSTEIVGEPQASPVEKEISLIVKSVHEPSIDEIPLLGALLEAFDFSEIYEYERVVEAPGGSRAEHLARFLQEALSTGRAVIMVAPSLLGVSPWPGGYLKSWLKSLTRARWPRSASGQTGCFTCRSRRLWTSRPSR